MGLRSRDRVMALLLVGCIGAFTVFTGGRFLSVANLSNLIAQNAYLVVITMAMVPVMIVGGLDLSIGSVVAVTGAVAGHLMVRSGTHPGLAVGLVLLLGLGIGVFHGLLIAYLRLPMFVVTLAGMLIWRGITLVILNGRTISAFPASFVRLGAGFLPLSWSVALTVVGVVWLHMFVMNKTIAGRGIYAVGGNRRAALFSGIPTRKLELAVYANSGFMAAVTGLLVSARLNAATPKAGTLFEIEAITACLIGGTSIAGGVGTVHGAVIGAAIIGVLNNGFSLSGIQGEMVVKAAVMLIAGFLDARNASVHDG